MLHIHMCTERGGPFFAGRALGGRFTKPPSIIFYMEHLSTVVHGT